MGWLLIAKGEEKDTYYKLGHFWIVSFRHFLLCVCLDYITLFSLISIAGIVRFPLHFPRIIVMRGPCALRTRIISHVNKYFKSTVPLFLPTKWADGSFGVWERGFFFPFPENPLHPGWPEKIQFVITSNNIIYSSLLYTNVHHILFIVEKTVLKYWRRIRYVLTKTLAGNNFYTYGRCWKLLSDK